MLNKGQEILLKLEDTDLDRSLEAFLARRSRWFPGGDWRKGLPQFEISVDGQMARLDQILRRGQQVELFRKPWQEPEVPMDIEVVFEDRDLLVVDKPSGLPSLPQGDYLEHTLLFQLREQFGNPLLTPSHRLDMETSGLMMLAKHAETRGWFQSQFQAGDVLKRYEALVFGLWPKSLTSVAIPLVKDPVIYTKFVPGEHGKTARTEVLDIGHFGEFSWLVLKPVTGRTNQLRAHLAAAGHPIVGDKKYHREPNVFLDWLAHRDWRQLESELRLPRQALHCRTLGCRLREGHWRQWRSRRETQSTWLSLAGLAHRGSCPSMA